MTEPTIEEVQAALQCELEGGCVGAEAMSDDHLLVFTSKIVKGKSYFPREDRVEILREYIRRKQERKEGEL